MITQLSSPFSSRFPPPRLRIDRVHPGRISGVSLLTTGPAKGHGFEIDERTVQQVVELAEGLPGQWTHGDASDPLARHLGQWTQLRLQASRVCRSCLVEATGDLTCGRCGRTTEVVQRALGDFVFSASAWKLRPAGLDVPAPDYLMARAEEDPRSLGISIVAGLELLGDAETRPRVARIRDRQLLRADWVGTPAANPTGLSAPPTGDPIATALDRLVAQEGEAQARLHAFAYLARYFGDTEERPPQPWIEPPRRAPAPPPSPTPSSPPPTLPQLEALQAQVEQLSTALREVQEARQGGTLRRLRERSAELGAPLTGDDLEAVESLLERGSDAAAQVLGDALLERAAQKCQSARSAPTTTPLAPPPLTPASTPEGSLAAQRAVLQASGAPLSPRSTPTPKEVTS